MKWGFCLFLLGLDVVSKLLSLKYIGPWGIPIFSLSQITCSFNLVFNTGAAWGILQGHSGMLFLLRLFIVAWLLFSLTRNKTQAFPLLLIATGAIGNGIDYLAYGHVIDFIHFRFWGSSFPIFNIADCCITIGAVLLFLTPRFRHAPHLHSRS